MQACCACFGAVSIALRNEPLDSRPLRPRPVTPASQTFLKGLAPGKSRPKARSSTFRRSPIYFHLLHIVSASNGMISSGCRSGLCPRTGSSHKKTHDKNFLTLSPDPESDPWTKPSPPTPNLPTLCRRHGRFRQLRRANADHKPSNPS